MLTREENERMTRVGPGTPAGDLLRRYWHPVAFAHEISDDVPTVHVRILGENLVLFKDKSGNVGLVADQCPHRGASLLYGRVEERGIACPYHGWLFDTQGNCVETPAEPAGSLFHLTVKHRAYPVQKFIGMFWAYLGPLPAPVIPKYDVWVRNDGHRRLLQQPQLDCNWMQAMENSVDPSHLQILHQALIAGDKPITSTTRGLTDYVKEFDFYETPFGIMKKRTYTDGNIDEHPVIFPNILRQGNATQIRVPIDDEHTKIFFVRFDATPDGSLVDDEGDPPVEYVRAYKDVPGTLHPFARFRMDEVQAQDHMAWETQGPIADRTTERLATCDRGVVMLRGMVLREIDRVAQGNDPVGVLRDPQHEMIDTKLMESVAEMRRNSTPQMQRASV